MFCYRIGGVYEESLFRAERRIECSRALYQVLGAKGIDGQVTGAMVSCSFGVVPDDRIFRVQEFVESSLALAIVLGLTIIIRNVRWQQFLKCVRGVMKVIQG